MTSLSERRVPSESGSPPPLFTRRTTALAAASCGCGDWEEGGGGKGEWKKKDRKLCCKPRASTERRGKRGALRAAKRSRVGGAAAPLRTPARGRARGRHQEPRAAGPAVCRCTRSREYGPDLLPSGKPRAGGCGGEGRPQTRESRADDERSGKGDLQGEREAGNRRPRRAKGRGCRSRADLTCALPPAGGAPGRGRQSGHQRLPRPAPELPLPCPPLVSDAPGAPPRPRARKPRPLPKAPLIGCIICRSPRQWV